MDAEQTIAEIERLERIFAVPDARPLSPSDLSAANQRHDEMRAQPVVPALALVRGLLPRRIRRQASDSELVTPFPSLISDKVHNHSCSEPFLTSALLVA
jgi:hypothetical protein